MTSAPMRGEGQEDIFSGVFILPVNPAANFDIYRTTNQECAITKISLGQWRYTSFYTTGFTSANLQSPLNRKSITELEGPYP